MTEVQEGRESGRNWPHGERRELPKRRATDKLHVRHAPPLTDEMRSWITTVLDQERAEGVREGQLKAEDGRIVAELVMFGLGALAGPALLWLLHRVFA